MSDDDRPASGATPLGGDASGPSAADHVKSVASSVLRAVVGKLSSVGDEPAAEQETAGAAGKHAGQPMQPFEPVEPWQSADRSGHLGAELGTASRATLRALFGVLDEVEAGGGELAGLGDQLRAVAALTSREPGVRRALTDGARAVEARSALAHQLLDGKVDPAAAEMTARAASGRWSAPRDLVDALDIIATAAEVAAADRAGALDSLEDDLFRFGRIVAADEGLRSALSNRTAPTSARAELVRRLLAGRASDAAVRLATAAATEVRGRSVEVALAEQDEVVAARRHRIVALVHTAHPLTADQHVRLAAALARQAGQPVQLNTVLDPSLVAGFHVEMGDSVVDASVASRLSEARRRLTG